VNKGTRLSLKLIGFFCLGSTLTADRCALRRADARVYEKTLYCDEQYRAMDEFAQHDLSRELRDIESLLSAQASTLYYMGFRVTGERRSDAGPMQRDARWRIYAEFAQRLDCQARKLYAATESGLGVTNTGLAGLTTNRPVIRSRFQWAALRSPPGGGDVATLAELSQRQHSRGLHPHFETDKCNDVPPRSALPESGRQSMSVYRKVRRFHAPYVLNAGWRLFVIAPSRIWMPISVSPRAGPIGDCSYATRNRVGMAYATARTIEIICCRVSFKDPRIGKTVAECF